MSYFNEVIFLKAVTVTFHYVFVWDSVLTTIALKACEASFILCTPIWKLALEFYTIFTSKISSGHKPHVQYLQCIFLVFIVICWGHCFSMKPNQTLLNKKSFPDVKSIKSWSTVEQKSLMKLHTEQDRTTVASRNFIWNVELQKIGRPQ